MSHYRRFAITDSHCTIHLFSNRFDQIQNTQMCINVFFFFCSQKAMILYRFIAYSAGTFVLHLSLDIVPI